MRIRPAGVVTLVFVAMACNTSNGDSPDSDPLPPGVEAISLLGDTLRPPLLSARADSIYGLRLAEARADWQADSIRVEHAIWLGRRTAYMGTYRAAIRIYSDAIAQWPEEARLYRHRGHRWLTVREIERSIDDFRTAARLTAGTPDALEPDGLPNARNIPTSTLQGNIWYHLGLAHYVRADYDSALAAYERDAKFATNPDMQVATTYWHYLTLRRLGRTEEAEKVIALINARMDIIENGGYFRLLLLFKDLLPIDSLRNASGDDAVQDATVGYGIGAWYLLRGDTAKAHEAWRGVISQGQWPAFGHLAAEAELSRAGPGS